MTIIGYCHYSKAHTKAAKEWLNTFEGGTSPSQESSATRGDEENDMSVLVCMTFADRLLAEVLDGNYGEAKAKIASHFEVGRFTHLSECTQFECV